MKRTMHRIITLAVALLVTAQTALGVTGVQLTIQGSDVVLTWPSQPGQTFIVGYRPAFDPATPWTFLTNTLPAAAGSQTTFTHSGAFQGGGGGQQMAAAFGGDAAQSQPVALTAEERAARIAASRDSAKKALAYLMAQLEAAIAKANAMREERAALLRAGIQPPAAAVAAEAESPAGDGPGGAMMSGSMGFYFVAEYAEDSDGDAVDNECELYIGHNLLNTDTDGDGIPDGAEDSYADGYDDATECILDGDPLTPEDGGFPPLDDGGVFSGEFTLTFTPNSNYTNILGPFLFCNNNVTADSLITTEPSPGNVRLQWHSVFIHYEPFAGPAGPDGPNPPNFTPQERDLLHDAFGEGTSFGRNTISQPNQAKIDALPRELLERYERFAAESVRETFELIQRANAGTYNPPGGLEHFMRTRIAFVHTQLTRMQGIASSLARRFGRAINRILPFAGGIIILANAESIAADFLDAMDDYARDIANGDDETGSAAILAGRCNDLAPGSGSIVLNYLLR